MVRVGNDGGDMAMTREGGGYDWEWWWRLEGYSPSEGGKKCAERGGGMIRYVNYVCLREGRFGHGCGMWWCRVMVSGAAVG